MVKQYRIHLVVIGLYILLTLFLTWPVAAHLATHIPGEATWAFDESTFIWNIWWFKFSLLNLQKTPLESSYIFFPLGINLTTYTFNLFNAAFSLPVQLALSLPLASNLALLFSYISSAYGTFLLALYVLETTGNRLRFSPIGRSLTVSYLAAFAGGAIFAFSASRMMYMALGHYNFVTLQWFPFYSLFLLKALRGGRAKSLLLAGLFAAFCLYAELTYSVFLIFITALVFLGQWLRQRNLTAAGLTGAGAPGFRTIYRAPVIRMLGHVLVIGLVTLLLTAPFILSVLPDFLDPAFAEPGWGEGLKLSADLIGLVTLTPLHPLSDVNWLGELRAVIEGAGRFQDANTLFLGYGVLTMALVGIWIWSGRRVWLWSVILFTVLSLGPLLTINGQNRFNLDGLEVTYPLPFALLHYIPLINANRVPNRFGIPLTLALAVLASAGVAWVLSTLESRNLKLDGSSEQRRSTYLPGGATLAVYLLLFALLLFDQYSVPLPLTDARIPGLYYEIGAEPDEFSLMQLPLGWRNSYGTLGAERTQLQYYQAAHRRPILGGNTSRNPDFKFNYYANIPLFAALTEAELYRNVDEQILEQARQQAAELMTLYNIKYLVIHEPIPHRKPYEDTFFTTRRLALDLIPHNPEPAYQSPGVEAFAVQQAAIPDSLSLDFGEWTSLPYRGEGWAADEEIFAATANWAIDSEALIFFPVRGSGERRLTVHIAPFSYPEAPPQSVSLELNGHRIGQDIPLREGWQAVETVLPQAALRQGLNRLILHFAHTAQPRQVLPAGRAIGNTGIDTPVDLEVNSGADFAFITAGFGEQAVDASAHRRGLNLAVIEAESGRVLSSKGFDTAANEFEAAALSDFIASIPQDSIVIMASKGLNATDFLNDAARTSLQSLGLHTELLRPPFSAIGIKGAASGMALQASGEGNGTAYLRLGASSDVRNLAAAVDKVLIQTPHD